jgi:ankyrin repeat protein
VAAGASLSCAGKMGWTPMHNACIHGRDAIVERLVAAGASLSCAHKDGKTPLHFSIVAGKAAIAEILVAAGSSVHCVDVLQGDMYLLAFSCIALYRGEYNKLRIPEWDPYKLWIPEWDLVAA